MVIQLPMFEVKISRLERKFAGLSLRDAHKQRTSILLRQTALRMFLAGGYDTTTAEDIAAKAGVSVRTFFRYFATKDEIVFKGQGAWAKAVAAGYLQQPEGLPRLEAICECFIEAAEGMDRKSVKAYAKIVENSQMLRGKAAELIAANIAEITGAVAKKHGLHESDAGARLFTEVVVAAYQTAVRDWRDERHAGPLDEAIREKFCLFHTLFAEAVVSAPSAKQVRRRRPRSPRLARVAATLTRD